MSNSVPLNYFSVYKNRWLKLIKFSNSFKIFWGGDKDKNYNPFPKYEAIRKVLKKRT